MKARLALGLKWVPAVLAVVSLGQPSSSRAEEERLGMGGESAATAPVPAKAPEITAAPSEFDPPELGPPPPPAPAAPAIAPRNEQAEAPLLPTAPRKRAGQQADAPNAAVTGRWQGPLPRAGAPAASADAPAQSAVPATEGQSESLTITQSAPQSPRRKPAAPPRRRRARPVAPPADGASTGGTAAAAPEASAPVEETSAPSIGAPWSLRGRIFSDIYVPTVKATENTFPYIATAAWLQADPKFDERTSGNLILDVNVVDAGESGTGQPISKQVNVDLREAYLGYADSGWDLRIGRQIIPWGKSDVVNPTDFLSARDYTRFNPDEEVKRIGATSVKTSWTPLEGSSPLTFTAVWTPIFPKSRLLIPVAEIPAGVTIGPDQPSPTNLASSEAALRATYFSSSWDFSLMGFRGYNHFPEFVFSSGTAAGGIVVAPAYHQVRALGADFSKTADDWVFRGETAYVWTENNDGQNPQIRPTHLDTVAGMEKAFGDNLRIQVQGILRYHPKYLAPDQMGGSNPQEIAINRQIAAANALVLGYQHRLRKGATFRISYVSEQSGWEWDALALMYFNDYDFLVRPKVTRAWTDTFKTSLGFDHYGGPSNSQLGALDGYNAAFLEAKFSY